MKSVLAIFGVILLSACSFYSEQTGWTLYRLGFYDAAMADWRKAAQDNDPGAAYQLGMALLHGVSTIDQTVIKRDPKRAVSWFRKSAKLGDARAQRELGTLYDNGQAGLPKSRRRAAQYYLAAARQGLPDAQYNIAVMFERGEGIDRDYVEAYKFYTLAIENDFATFAGPSRDRLAHRMSRAEIELAKMRAAGFQHGDHASLGGL